MMFVGSQGSLQSGLGLSKLAAVTWLSVGFLFSVTSCTQVTPNAVQQAPQPSAPTAVTQTTVTHQNGVAVITLPQQSVATSNQAMLASAQYQPLPADQVIASVPQGSRLPPGRSGNLSSEYMRLHSLRQQIASRDIDRNPSRRPSQLPGIFPKERWSETIPLFASGTSAKLSSDFGWRNLRGRKDFHGGIDIIVPPNEPVKAVRGGEVVWINHSGYWGGIVVSTGERLYTYWHTRPLRQFRIGDRVSAGQTIARVTDAGAATHLHYAVHLVPGGDWRARNDSNAIDPLIMARQAGVL